MKGANYQKVKSKVNKTIKINKSKIGTENKTAKKLPKKDKEKSVRRTPIKRIVFQDRENDADKFLLNMTEYNVIMLSLSAFFVVIRSEYWIMLPNNAGDLKKRVTKVF